MSNTLPQLADLHHDVALAFKNDQYKLLVNQQPSEKWIKKHPTAKVKNDQNKEVPASYLPTDKVEFLLDRIFQDWKLEVLSTCVMFNSVAVTVRLHYKNPVNGEWMFHDGVGAKGIQKDANTAALTIETIKPEAVQMALPSAKSYALKDAADHIGKLFGRDLNRRNTINFKGSYSESSPPEDTAPPPPPTIKTQDINFEL